MYVSGEDLPADTSELGTCEKFEANRGSSIFVGLTSQATDEATERLSGVKEQLRHPGNDAQTAGYLSRRLSRLSGGIAVIRVGGATELEVRERKDRIDDAVCATRAAAQGGIVAGGGTSFLRILKIMRKSKNVPKDLDEKAGWDLLLKALETPLRQIATNSGLVPEVVLAKVMGLSGHQGFDARAGKYYDLLDAGVIDPLPVVMAALEHATSAALNLLSVGCAMTFENNDVFNE